MGTLPLALCVSVALHAALLAVRLAAPEAFDRVFQDTPLEVILVNARSTDIPDKAQAIAQASLAGGGDADLGRASSPLPPSMVSITGEDSEQNQQQQLRELQEQQNLMLAQVKNLLASMPPVPPRQGASSAEQMQREQKRRQLVNLLAEIERRINIANARPRKRYISPSTKEAVYAVYYDHMRRAIEDKGTENFPQSMGQKLYGALTVSVSVNHDGRVLAVEVLQSSGIPALDRRAVAIARSAGPFGKFSKDMRRQFDQIEVISRFTFTRDQTLDASVSTK